MALDEKKWPGENLLLDTNVRQPEVSAENAKVTVVNRLVHIVSLNIVDAPAVLAQSEKSLDAPDDTQG